MLKEMIIKLRAKYFELPFKGSMIYANAFKKYNIDPNKPLDLYKEIFGSDQTQTTVKLQNIGKVYENGFKAIHNLNLDIKPHEFVSLLGPSGCGKTTILRMIAGLETISEGKFTINDVLMNSSLPKERSLAMVFQNYALYPYMSVYENIAFGLKIGTLDNKVSVDLLDQALLALNPSHLDVKYNKVQIFKLKHSKIDEIREAKAKIKKENKVKSNEVDIKALRQELKYLKEVQGSDRKQAANQIQKIKEEIQLLKKPNNLEIANKQNQIKELQKQNANSNQEAIKKLKQEISNLKKSQSIISPEKLKEFHRLLKNYLESVVVWKKSIPARVDYFADLVGIKAYLRRKPAALSGGQRQRVALVRAISKNASIFLFDEPLSNLDAKLRASMRTEIKSLHTKMKATSIFVTHDQVEAMTMSDKIVLMNKGYIQQVGTPQELFNNPANVFVADFIGSPRINFVKAKLKKETQLELSSGQKIELTKPQSNVAKKMQPYFGKEVILGIRPQNIITDAVIISESKENIFTVKVDSIENIGHENIIITSSKEFGNGFRVVTGRYIFVKPGDTMKIMLNANTMQVFEAKNGISISSVFNEETETAQKIWLESSKERIRNQILSVKEQTKDRLSHRAVKAVYYKLNKKHGDKVTNKKSQMMNKAVIDESLVETIQDQGGN